MILAFSDSIIANSQTGLNAKFGTIICIPGKFTGIRIYYDINGAEAFVLQNGTVQKLKHFVMPEINLEPETSAIDMIFHLFTNHINCKENRNEITIFASSFPAHFKLFIGDFCKRLDALELTEPKRNYSQIFNEFSHNDKTYHENHMRVFQDKTTDILELHKNNSDICVNVNQGIIVFNTFENELFDDFILELFYLYRRFHRFPSDRRQIYTKHSSHAYVTILSRIHELRCHCYLTVDLAFIKSVVIEMIDTVKAAMRTRSELFQDMYELFKKSPNGRFYYPFKIFSPTLFVMEHLLSL